MIKALFKSLGYVKEKPIMERLSERQSKINGLRREISELQSRIEIQKSTKVVASNKEH